MDSKAHLLSLFHNHATLFLEFLAYNEPTLMAACHAFNDRIQALHDAQIDLFHKTHGTAQDPGQGLGYGANVTWRRVGSDQIHFIGHRDDKRSRNYCWWLSTEIPAPWIDTNQEFISALIPKYALDEDDKERTLASLLKACSMTSVDADFVASFDDFRARLWSARTDLEGYLDYSERQGLQPEHVVYLVPHLATCWPNHTPEFKRPPRKIKGINPPSHVIRDGARIIASHRQAVLKWRQG